MAILQQGAGENTLKQLDNMLQMTPEQSRNGHSRAISRLLVRPINNNENSSEI